MVLKKNYFVKLSTSYRPISRDVTENHQRKSQNNFRSNKNATNKIKYSNRDGFSCIMNTGHFVHTLGYEIFRYKCILTQITPLCTHPLGTHILRINSDGIF